MRLALISDIHGNQTALAAVLSDIEKAGADQVVCLGDVATLGPHPQEAINLLRERHIDCILGNHDAFLTEPSLITTYTDQPLIVQSVDWCRSQLDQEDLAFLASFPLTISMSVADGCEVLLFHGSPRSHMEDLLATTPPERLDELLAGHAAAVMACGHTHIQMLRQHKGRLLLNPGSVGCPFKEYVAGKKPRILAHAEYAILEVHRGAVQASLRRVPLDKKALYEEVELSDMPLRSMMLGQYS